MKKLLTTLLLLTLPPTTFAQTNYTEEPEIISAKGIVGVINKQAKH